MTWLAGWSRRKKLLLSRPSGSISDYQMKIEVGKTVNSVKKTGGFVEDWYTQPYTVSQSTVNSVSNNILDITALTKDSWIEMYSIGSFNPVQYTHFIMKYKVISGTDGPSRIFFLNTRRTAASGDQNILLGTLNADGNWHTLIANASTHQYWNDSNITGWRFDYIDDANQSSYRMQIDYIGLVSLADINCASNCLDSFNDLRFVNESNTVLNYWIEDIYGETPNLTATVWVKFNSIGTTSTPFYMYYDKSDATSYSNGGNTFIKFEDFEWGSNGTNLTTSSGSVTWVNNGSATSSISTEQVYKGTRSGKVPSSTAGANYYYFQPVTVANDVAFSVKFYKETAITNGPNICIGTADNTQTMGFWIDVNEDIYINNSNTVTKCIPDAWQIIECYNMNTTAKTFTLKLNNKTTLTGLTTNYGTSTFFRLLNADTAANGRDFWVDEIIVRKYTGTEPTIVSVGGEESYSTGTTSWKDFRFEDFKVNKVYLGSNLVFERSVCELPLPLFWLDAQDSSTVTQSSGIVSEWRNKAKSFGKAVQATSGYRPSYSGTAVTFDGNDNYLNCEATITDPFTSNSSFDSDLWTVVNNCTLVNGKARLSNSSGNSYLISKIPIWGDFDIQVDFNLITYPSTNSWGAVINLAGGSRAVQTHRGYSGGIHKYYKGYYDGSSWSSTTEVAASGSSGKLRMTRVGNVFTCYYWGGSSWTTIGSSITQTFTVPLEISIQVARWDSNPTAVVDFDNFSMTLPDGSPIKFYGTGNYFYFVALKPTAVTVTNYYRQIMGCSMGGYTGLNLAFAGDDLDGSGNSTVGSTHKYRFEICNNSTDQRQSVYTPTDSAHSGVPALLGFGVVNSTMYIYLDGTVSSGTALYSGLWSSNAFNIGLPTTSGSYYQGDIYEIISIKDFNMTDGEKIEGYLAHKWGLVSNLPSNHPFKLSDCYWKFV